MSVGRILVFGAGGQVGKALQRVLPAIGEVVALNSATGDLSNPDALRDTVRALRPSVIVNAGAYTAVDKAESEPERAFAINEAGPGILAQEAAACGACLIQYSTDYVYNGQKPSPYQENDPVDPQSVYGRSKLAGEKAVRAACSRHLILRTSWVFAATGTNFLRTMLRLARERDGLRVVSDQIGAPTSADLIAECTVTALRALAVESAVEARWGTYHLVASGVVSWHGYAQRIIGGARARGMATRATPETVEGITTAEYPTPAKRPANSRLDTAKLRQAFPQIVLPDWTVGVDLALDQIAAAG